MKKQKVIRSTVWKNADWVVVEGSLVPSPGRPPKPRRLFQYVGEKLPFACLKDVKKAISDHSDDLDGVYLAHDSMGVARYGGRGRIFRRLASHFRKYPRVLVYFSFYVIKNKSHEREIETAILRAASPQLILNQRKIREGIDPGSVRDYERGTRFFQRREPPRHKKAKAKNL